MKIKRMTAGEYEMTTEQGLVVISKKGNKWEVTFPCGKKSIRKSYELAKKWAITYLAKTKIVIVTNEENKPKKESKKYLCGNVDVKQVVNNHCHYFTGAEYYGCFNSGNAPVILNLKIQNVTYYIVGKQSDITDLYVDKYVAQIKREIMDNSWVHLDNEFNYKTKNGVILVTKKFPKAYKEFMSRNNEVLEYNKQASAEVTIAKKNQDYLTLMNHGFVVKN